MFNFKNKNCTKTKLEKLEKEVSTLTEKFTTLEKFLSKDFDRLNILEKIVSNNTNSLEEFGEIVCDGLERLDNLEYRMNEFDISDENDSIMYSIQAKLEYIIKILEK